MKRGSVGSPIIKGNKKPKVHGDYDQYTHLNTTYYKHPITCQKANSFNNSSRKKPLDILKELNSKQEKLDGIKTFIHWFRGDLRVHDNRALSEALEQFKKCKEQGPAQFLTIFTINEHDWRAHLDGGWKLKFMLKAINSLGEKLSKMSIPLHVLHFKPDAPALCSSSKFATWLKDECSKLAKESGPTLVTANLQYEADEQYRDIKVFEQCDSSFKFKVYHDACVVNPGTLATGKGTQYTVFTPWYKKWIEVVQKELSDSNFVQEVSDKPVNDEKVKFEAPDYELPSEFAGYIPEGGAEIPEASEKAALEQLSIFLKDKIHNYEDKDHLPDEGSSHLSCYITSGLISTRVIVKESVKESNGAVAAKDVRKNSPVQEFIREVAWRDFYKHAFSNWPFLSMDIPYHFELNDMKWRDDEEAFKNWCEGTTGVPIVDAIMRKLLCTGYINNRARMITASFMCKNLLLDYRWGERWFRRHLIDFDLASNVGGWGFCSSTGIDSQPYFRILNMEIQSKKFDPDGDYIRKWVPELKDCKDVHTFHLARKGYKSAIVNYKKSREDALATYREII